MINVTKSYLPPLEVYQSYLKKIWDSGHLTNHGPLVLELEENLKEKLGVKHLFYVNNGTIALQIAIKALGLSGEIITTPFSYVATTSSIIWENAVPIFADVSPDDFTIDPKEIEKRITPTTSAILATHVYGIPCKVKEIESLAKKHGIKVIYDAAHAFGVKYEDVSVLNYGDVSTLSFHATKLFHTVEGGAIITNDDELAHRISYMRNFGHNGQEEFWGIGINGKSSEFHAAMGLSLLPYIDDFIQKRKELSEHYVRKINEKRLNFQLPEIDKSSKFNYAYFPVLLENESEMLHVKAALNSNSVFPRRYFYPSLNKLPYVPYSPMPVAEGISSRILCLPLFFEMNEKMIDNIIDIISENINARSQK